MCRKRCRIWYPPFSKTFVHWYWPLWFQAFTQAGVKRKFDLCLTAANAEHSPDGMPVAAWWHFKLTGGHAWFLLDIGWIWHLRGAEGPKGRRAEAFTLSQGGSFVYHHVQVGSSFTNWTELWRQGLGQLWVSESMSFLEANCQAGIWSNRFTESPAPLVIWYPFKNNFLWRFSEKRTILWVLPTLQVSNADVRHSFNIVVVLTKDQDNGELILHIEHSRFLGAKNPC